MPEATAAPASPADAPPQNPPSRLRRLLRDHLGWMLSLFLVGLAFKYMALCHSENSLPFLDQWDGEAIDLYVPYLEHQLTLADLFRANNEHRILWTRLYDLALFVLNGQWDSQLQIVLNAAIHCAALAGFGGLIAGMLGKRSWPLIWPPLALALVLPLGVENTVWGFQSQFYFLLVFTFLTLWLLGLGKPLSSRWRLGALAGVAALFTVASGFLAAVAVAGLVVLDILKDRAGWRRHLPTLAVCAVLTIAGLLLKVDVPRHHVLQAHSPGEFALSLGRFLAWPSVQWPWFALFNFVPLALLAWVHFRSREPDQGAERMVLGVGIWVVLQALASAYARGYGGKVPAWRYMDTCSFVMIANWLAIVLLLTRYRCGSRWKSFSCAGIAVWIAACIAGLWMLTARVVKVILPSWAARQAIRLEVTRSFMATDDERYFQREESDNIPYYFVPEITTLLRLPDIRGILPACAREALKVTPSDDDPHVFVRNGAALATNEPPTETCWGSFARNGGSAGGVGKFTSQPVKASTLPYLEIPVAGDLGDPALKLELIDMATGKTTEVKPAQPPGGKWVNVYVKAPAGAFKIVATDDSTVKWFAFKDPRELGRLSYWAMNALHAWKFILAAGLVCLVWSVAGLVACGAEGEPRTQPPAA